MKKRTVHGRKLLVASIGVASVLYGCEKRDAYPPGNLVAPPPPETGIVTSGNLVAPPPQADASGPLEVKPQGADDAGVPLALTAPPGNLMPPPKPTAPPKPTTSPTHHPPGNLMPPPPPSGRPTPKAK